MLFADRIHSLGDSSPGSVIRAYAKSRSSIRISTANSVFITREHRFRLRQPLEGARRVVRDPQRGRPSHCIPRLLNKRQPHPILVSVAAVPEISNAYAVVEPTKPVPTIATREIRLRVGCGWGEF